MKKIGILLLAGILIAQTAFAADLTFVTENATVYRPAGTQLTLYVTGQNAVTFTGNSQIDSPVYFFVGKPYYPSAAFNQLNEGEPAKMSGGAFSFTVSDLQGYSSPVPVFAAQQTDAGIQYSEPVFLEYYPDALTAQIEGNRFAMVTFSADGAPVILSDAVVTIGGVEVPYAVTERKRQISFPVYLPEGAVDTTVHVQLTDLAGYVVQAEIDGWPVTDFSGSDAIDRAGFATMLAESLKLNLDSGAIAFSDRDYIPLDVRRYAGAVQQSGLMIGDGNIFDANGLLTREMAAVIVVRAATGAKVATEATFSDLENVSDWAREAVCTASNNGIINGYPDGSFRPSANVTVQEAAQMVVNLIQFLGQN